MKKPAAKEGDSIDGVCNHSIDDPQTPQIPFSNSWKIGDNLSGDVTIDGRYAALKGSKGKNLTHQPKPTGTLCNPPTASEASISDGSKSVTINGQPAARHGDLASGCGSSQVVVAGARTANVFIGD